MPVHDCRYIHPPPHTHTQHAHIYSCSFNRGFFFLQQTCRVQRRKQTCLVGVHRRIEEKKVYPIMPTVRACACLGGCVWGGRAGGGGVHGRPYTELHVVRRTINTMAYGLHVVRIVGYKIALTGYTTQERDGITPSPTGMHKRPHVCSHFLGKYCVLG